MNNKKSTYKIVIITPLFFNNASGASVYYQLLASLLANHGHKITVISDKERGGLAGRYHPLFPVRSGRNKRKIRDIIAYVVQNFQYCKIVGILEKENPNIVLIHSSFYNYPGFFSYFMDKMFDKYKNIKWISDVRDHCIPISKIPQLNKYNKVIACSENINEYLVQNGISQKKISFIPVLQENFSDRHPDDAGDIVRELKNKTYILYIGSIKKEKGVLLLLKSFIDVVLPQILSCRLVLVGLLKDNDRELKKMLQHQSVIYTGAKSRTIICSLINSASLCVNLSPIEGMPRASLEALALKRPVVLPPNVPEFDRYCSDFVAYDVDPVKVGKQMLSILRSQKIPNYPIEKHSLDYIYNSYEEILF